MLAGTREGTRVRENVRVCGQMGLDKGDMWPDLKAHSGTRWKQNSRCGSPVAWGNPLCLLRTPMDGQGPLADSPGGRRALLNPAPSVNRIPLGTIPADLSPRSSHMGRQAAPPGVSRPAPTLATTPRIRLPASASQGVTTMTASPAGRRSGRVSAPGLQDGRRSPRTAGHTERGDGCPESHGRARARTTSPLGQESPTPPGAEDTVTTGAGRRDSGSGGSSPRTRRHRAGRAGPQETPSHAESLAGRWQGGQGRTGPPRPEVGTPLRSSACPHRSEDRGTLTRRRPSADGGSTDHTRAAGARPGPPAGPRLCLRPGLGGGREDSPRNFLGGLSRSPAAGSTTQRSSTNLRDEAASQHKDDARLPRHQQGLQRDRARDGMEGWVSRCKLSYMEWASNRVLLSSTENYILEWKRL